MKPLQFETGKNKCKKESEIQEEIIKMLTLRGWYTIVMHGNIFTHGYPDLFTTHSKYGVRLIEVKRPDNFSFTGSQLDKFPKLMANGCGVFILTGADEENYSRLFKSPNAWAYISGFLSK